MSGVPANEPTIFVNDAPRALNGTRTLAELVSDLGLAARKGVAVAVNGSVVGRTLWAAQGIKPGDRILVIRATQGG